MNEARPLVLALLLAPATAGAQISNETFGSSADRFRNSAGEPALNGYESISGGALIRFGMSMKPNTRQSMTAVIYEEDSPSSNSWTMVFERTGTWNAGANPALVSVSSIQVVLQPNTRYLMGYWVETAGDVDTWYTSTPGWERSVDRGRIYGFGSTTFGGTVNTMPTTVSGDAQPTGA